MKKEKIEKIKEILEFYPHIRSEKMLDNEFVECWFSVLIGGGPPFKRRTNKRHVMDGYAVYAIQEAEKILQELLRELEDEK